MGQHRHDGEILDAVMGVALGAIGEAAADGDHGDRQVVVADVVAQLFEAAQRGEIGDGVEHHAAAGQRQACGDADHRLFADADVGVLVGQGFGKSFQHGIAEVGGEQHDVWMGAGVGGQHVDGFGSHALASISARAASSWASLGLE